MPPLSLEEVLARSMRLPRDRARRTATGVFAPTVASAALSPAGPSGSGLDLSRRGAARRKQTLQFFEMLEKEDAARSAGHLAVRPSAQLVHNSADLLTYLRTAQRMRSWQDALAAFTAATGIRTPISATPTADDTATASAASAAAAAAVSPSSEHVSTLLETLLAADQWALLLATAQFFGAEFPDALEQAVGAIVRAGDPAPGPQRGNIPAPLAEALVAHGAAAAATTTKSHEAALLFLQHSTLPPSSIPVGCYNAIVGGCEETKDWRAALRIVRAMGPNPLQEWRAPAEDAAPVTGLGLKKAATDDGASSISSGSSPVAEASSSSSSSSTAAAAPPAYTSATTTPPEPDAVTYATLLVVLEQAGQGSLAAQVLDRLPPLDKEKITASYAALIFVWSNQVYSKQRRGGK